MTEREKLTNIAEQTKLALRTVRDLKVLAKSTKKTKFTKIERHTALLVDLLRELLLSLKDDK